MNRIACHDPFASMYQPDKRARRFTRPRGERDEARANKRCARLHPRLERVLKSVAKKCGLGSRAILRTKKGSKRQTDARAEVAWQLRQFGWTLTEIGKAMGRDHGTVSRMIQRHGARIGMANLGGGESSEKAPHQNTIDADWSGEWAI